MMPIAVAYHHGIPQRQSYAATHLSTTPLGSVEGFRIRRQFNVGLQVGCLHNLKSVLNRPAYLNRPA
jgi:hypothetical protein